MRKIAVEEHVFIPEGNGKDLAQGPPEFRENYARLVDVAEVRLQEMDAAEIEVSVLSVTAPGLQGVPDAAAAPRLAREWNDQLARAAGRHPDRFKVFAALPMADPQRAVEELRRCVRELGFVGALLNGYDDSGGSDPRYYDAPGYLDFWRAAAELGVPVYLHPRLPPAGRITTYSGYPELYGSACGFHVETAEHALRLILSGLFDKVPGLRILLGHLGELLPWWAWRIDHRIEREGWRDLPATRDRPRRHTVSEYLHSHFYVSTSGYFDTAGLEHTLRFMGSDRVLFAVDYPYESCREASEWFEALPMQEDDKRKIAYDNAAHVLGLRGGRRYQ